MKHKNYSSNIIKIFMTIMVMCVSPMMRADYFNKAVGESFILPIPKCPVKDGYVNSWSYSCSDYRVNITNRGSNDVSEAVISSYFNGTTVIECFFQYLYYINNTPYSATSYEYHQVSCIENNISISGPKSQLKVGESMQLTYNFANYTYGVTPEITWRCGSNAATVNYNGYVTALKPGEATITASSNLGGNVASYTISVIEDTGLDSMTDNNAKIWTNGLEIHVENAPINEVVNLIAINGDILSTRRSYGEDMIIKSPCKGIYLLSIGKQTYRVFCK